MINVQELRIGNLIKSIQSGKIFMADLFLFHEVYDDETYQDHFMPIPIAPDILLKCGFTGKEDKYWLEINNAYFAFDSKDNSISLYEWSGDGITYGKPLKYLHQLQNAVQSLTQTELEITF